MSSLECVRDALSGTTSHDFESNNSVPYSMLVGTPVKNGDKTVGTLVAGFDLSAQDFVQEMKDIFNVDCTVFQKDKRVSSTLKDEKGKSVVGTVLGDDSVVSRIKKGETVETIIEIGKEDYLNIYFPLTDETGGVTGMMSTAKSMNVVAQVVISMIQTSVTLLIIFGIIMMVGSGFILSRLLKPLFYVRDTLDSISSGKADLTKRLKAENQDEIGQVVHGFNTFAEKLQHIISHMKESKVVLESTGDDMEQSSDKTASSITEIIANIESIHGQIVEQTASVDSTAGAVDEITSNIFSLNHMIENQSSGVTEASAAVEEMIGNIHSVSHSMEKMSSAFSELESHAQSGFTKLETVNKRVQQIENESQLLQDANQAIANIASQTNLLAMNAAIEAAHAGEAGKGFAVVADEIRKLSETSSSQSKTIGKQLQQIRESIKNVVDASTESSQAFALVSKELEDTDHLVLEIRSAMEEQNEGSRQITEALKLMNDSTVEVRNASVEMNAGSKVILEAVHHLQDVTVVMKSSMDEMHIGANQINETGATLSQVSHKVKHAIDKMGNQIDQFTV